MVREAVEPGNEYDRGVCPDDDLRTPQPLPSGDAIRWAVSSIEALQASANHEVWHGLDEHRPGVFSMPWCEMPSSLLDFTMELDDRNFVRRGYSMEVLQRFEADPGGLETLSFVEGLHLLTSFVRGERFCEGYLAGKLNDGSLVAVLRQIGRAWEAIESSGRKTVCVLKVGAEGGSIGLLARPQKDGRWEYVVTTDESLFQDVSDERADDRDEPIRWIADWGEALRTLDRYPWPVLLPLHVDLGFRLHVLEAVAARLEERSMPEEARTMKREEWDQVAGES